MRKSTVLIVVITFTLSVILVGIFGMQMMSYNTRIYVEKIIPTQVTTSTGVAAEIKEDENPNEYRMTLHYTEGLIIRIDYEITPADATDNTVKATITNHNESNPVAELDGLNLRILRTGTIRLNYRATDGNGTEITIRIFIVA